MKQVLLALVLLAIGAAVFAALALNRGLVEPHLLDLGIDPEGPWLRAALKAVGTIFIGVPVALLFWSIAGLGSGAAGTDIHGYTILRLRSGSRYFLSAASLALAGLFLFVAAEDVEGLLWTAFMSVFGVFFLFGAWFIWTARVSYDNRTIAATQYTGTSRRHDWSDLVMIERRDEQHEFILRFRTGRKARISFFYQGVGELMALAERKLDENAGATRSRDRAPGAASGHGRAAYRPG